jgi:hypothetical protein
MFDSFLKKHILNVSPKSLNEKGTYNCIVVNLVSSKPCILVNTLVHIFLLSSFPFISQKHEEQQYAAS